MRRSTDLYIAHSSQFGGSQAVYNHTNSEKGNTAIFVLNGFMLLTYTGRQALVLEQIIDTDSSLP